MLSHRLYTAFRILFFILNIKCLIFLIPRYLQRYYQLLTVLQEIKRNNCIKHTHHPSYGSIYFISYWMHLKLKNKTRNNRCLKPEAICWKIREIAFLHVGSTEATSFYKETFAAIKFHFMEHCPPPRILPQALYLLVLTFKCICI